MSGVTGIEIGQDFCVLVAAQAAQSALRLSTARLVPAAEWGPPGAARVELLRTIRTANALPAACAAVVWDTGETSQQAELLQPLTQAGFRVQSVSSPPQALAALARITPASSGQGATAWVALNTSGAALVVVRGGAIIYSRVMGWSIAAPAERRQAHLLRRYLRVAQIASELKRAAQTVRATDGVAVESAVLCGNLPELRSLAMPLIEATDLEVETLDSTSGLDLADMSAADVEELAPAVRLATAVALSMPAAERAGGAGRIAALAAGLALVAAVAWWTYTQRGVPAAPPQPDSAGAVVGMRPPEGEAPATASSQGTTPAAATPVREPVPDPAAGAPEQTLRQQPSESPETAATSGQIGGRAETTRQDSQSRGGQGAARDTATTLPSVEGVLISPQLRLAVIDGAVVGIGDVVGSLTVKAIETDAVVLRDAAGQDVRVPVRQRLRPIS
ncbi:MAG TPA: hypothetical protein VD833_14085 [Vicinamibacterales bacterium]|nr:hypothetical protein [Vicinamibacterales bacterium]